MVSMKSVIKVAARLIVVLKRTPWESLSKKLLQKLPDWLVILKEKTTTGRIKAKIK